MPGSSPLTRGKQGGEFRYSNVPGLIPAHAGKTTVAPFAAMKTGAHPRSRGENAAGVPAFDFAAGSSPLTRGKLISVVRVSPSPRLIPAHAGKTTAGGRPRLVERAHPRSRGENHLYMAGQSRMRGSSPLTRGKRQRSGWSFSVSRLIPAHAGKTVRTTRRSSSLWAHPRSRGENSQAITSDRAPGGSSPLTRGKQVFGDCFAVTGRLIPAHAGKTLPDLRFYCADRSDLGNP